MKIQDAASSAITQEEPPLSLLEALKKAADFLKSQGVPEARLDSEWLFAHVLGCERLDLYLNFEQALEKETVDRLRILLKRRAQREPLQYLLGYTPFLNLRLRTDARALIPRPETELLATLLTQDLLTVPPQSVLDLGTGSGALALALAAAFPKSSVTAVDLSEQALSLAKENALASQLHDRVAFLASDWFSAVEGTFDLIVANPPYLTTAEYASAEAEIRLHEPEQALVALQHGIADLRLILTQAQAYLKPGGLIALETGIDHHPQLSQIAAEFAYGRWESKTDWNSYQRFFLAWKE